MKGKTIVGQRMNDAEMLIFRGFDKKKRAIVLVLRRKRLFLGIRMIIQLVHLKHTHLYSIFGKIEQSEEVIYYTRKTNKKKHI